MIDGDIIRSSVLQKMQQKYRAKRLQRKSDNKSEAIIIHLYEDDFASELGIGFEKIGEILVDLRNREFKKNIKDIFVENLGSDVSVFLRGNMEPEDVIRKGKSYYDITLTDFLPFEELGNTKPEIYVDRKQWVVSIPGIGITKLYKVETKIGKKIIGGALFGILGESFEKTFTYGSILEDFENMGMSGKQLNTAVDDVNKKLKKKKLPMHIVADKGASTLCLTFYKEDSKIR